MTTKTPLTSRTAKDGFIQARRRLDTLTSALDYYNLKHRHFSKCLQHAGLRQIRFHDKRHTYATLLLMQGESPVYFKEQLGHSSIKVTVDIYSHWIPGANRQAVNRLPLPAAKTATKATELLKQESPGITRANFLI
jgi:integrase